ncbi:ferredoxin [Mycolicibacterium sp. jd]|jgi:ferredoxin|uniref:ferredoxin n=1 Tax=unclassified Mycolicibacterium TaxID=2636767 RepID=UPI00298C5B3C|nr:ferredoxin [Mycolicibacterium sp. D5.8-2]MDW5611859.1 ferredoxin [Mycolicibacterium sp. D5.8-2]
MAAAGRIIFNRSTCAGIGLCEMHAPDFFEIADGGDGQMTLLRDTVEPARRAEVEEAAASCPTQSIQVIDA